MLPADISVLMFMMIMYISFCINYVWKFFVFAMSNPIQSAVKFCHWDAAVK